MSSSSGSFSGRSSSSSACSSSRGDSEISFDAADELLQFGSRRMELRKEKDLLRKSKPHSIELVRRLELHSKSLSESRLEDTARIQTMEIELLNCYKEIGYLRDQLIFKSKEVSYLNEHVRNIESKLAESGDFEEVKFLREELCMSKSEHLLLLQELESKETELQFSSLSVEKLEETISSLTLESLCEIESMKLDITALEQALVDAMRIQEESIQEKDQLRGVVEEVQFQSREAQEKAKYVEKLNEELRKRIAASEKSIKEFFQSTKERLESENEEQPPLNGDCFFAELSHVFPLSSEVRECFDAIIKRLKHPRNATLIDKMEGMGKQIHLHEDLVKRLKEELKQEKLKAKEEAEDLTQEMAELRYKMTCLVDEERKRRVCVEQASLQRIAELEAQVFYLFYDASCFFFVKERLFKHKTAGSGSNPFDSDDELDDTLKPSNRMIAPEPSLAAKNLTLNPFDDDDCDEVEKRFTTSSKPSLNLDAKRSRYRNGFRDSGGVENQSVQELESYAVYKSRETTKTVQGCLKVAQGIRSDATRTLVMLNEQGEKITRTHQKTVDIDHDLSRGEKLLGSLVGESPKRRVNHLETREKLGLNHFHKPQSRTPREPLPESPDAYQKLEVEKAKQDDGLADLSDLLSELKNMAVDMGTEIERQNNGLDHLQDDVDELNFRVKQSNQRARRLLRK
ncbi:hypothetical protein F2Q69_00000307 [Brassica cretica]|uniref:t-SNARE coiled-coil homology domain-containing protein n=1 Tax=Brassica cretica TaxID=69181 RepID=A0A8S9PED6_BRACR|nr:hypothetical protein F2Q69_00000307 [Brassica cretica]